VSFMFSLHVKLGLHCIVAGKLVNFFLDTKGRQASAKAQEAVDHLASLP